jgi:tetratricopeptide (TPR) repeat protein
MSERTAPVADLFAEAQRCLSAKRLGEAERLYRRILTLDDRHAGSWHGLGDIALLCGRPDAAIGFLGKAILIRDDVAPFHAALGNAFEQHGRLEDASTSFQRALTLNPDDAGACASLGTVWGRLGKLEDAVACFERALELEPGSANAVYNLGFAFEKQGKLETALTHYEHVLALAPHSAEILCSIGRMLFALKRVEDALAVLERAVTLMPGNVDAWNNRGTVLLQMDRPMESLASYDRVLALSPSYALAWLNRGNALVRLKRRDEALASFAQAQALKPDLAAAYLGESLCHLRGGDLRNGWEKYEWRALIRPDLMRVFPSPPWRATEEIAGKAILLHSEQGFGDTLQFCRYVPLVAACGARVVLEVPPVLKRLMTTLDGVADLRAQGEPLPDVDTQCPLLSLPRAFDTALETIPAQVPYLSVPEDVSVRWRERLRPTPGPRIGLTWFGRVEHLGEIHRSIAPDLLTPLLSCGATVVSLQKAYRPADQAWLAAHPDVLDFSDELEDFTDTAAVASAMDVVVTIDTATAHLAGALGLPVWIMLSHIGDWRWMEGRADSPWYPTAKLYRQTTVNDWSEVIARVAGDLRKKFAV